MVSKIPPTPSSALSLASLDGGLPSSCLLPNDFRPDPVEDTAVMKLQESFEEPDVRQNWHMSDDTSMDYDNFEDSNDYMVSFTEARDMRVA